MVTLREIRGIQASHNNISSAIIGNYDHSNNLPPVILHRIPNVASHRIIKPGLPGAGVSDEDLIIDEGQTIIDETFRQFLNHNWWHLHLVSTSLFAVASVLSLIRMLPYMVVSEALGPLEISLGTMVSKTLHFFVFIGVVFLAFAVGLTYIYSYYDGVNLQICVEVNGVNNCQSGSFAK